MKQIVFFTDPGKDGDDLIATIHTVIQAKLSGIIPADTPIKLVTVDEIPCDQYGKQCGELNGEEYGLRAYYLTMQIAKIAKAFDLSANQLFALPQVIAGPTTSYYNYDELQKKYTHAASNGDAFYPTTEVLNYYQSTLPESDYSNCLLSSSNKPDAWLENIKQLNPEDTILINIASFNGISDFLSQIPKEEQQKFTVLNMGYNKPYSKGDYQSKVENPTTLPYNARSTDKKKATSAIDTLAQNNVFHVVSGTTRTLPKYSGNSWLVDFQDVTSRSYPLLTGQLSPTLLSSLVEFTKSSKYKAFWPHDVVPTLMALIEMGAGEKLSLPNLTKDMLFTEVTHVSSEKLHLRMINDTGVLIDSSVPAQENDIAINSSEDFIYGKELDVIFFTSFLHLMAMEALPEIKKYEPLSKNYREIISLKADLHALKQQGKTNPQIEQKIKSAWAQVCLMELQQQLAFQMHDQLNPEMNYIMGAEATGFSLAKFTKKQTVSLHQLIKNLIEWSNIVPENRDLLTEELLKWIKDIAELMQAAQFDLSDNMMERIHNALAKVSKEKKLTPLTSAFFTQLRTELMPGEQSCILLKQNGELSSEFKRTGNSLLFYRLASKGNFGIAFPTGVHGMSEEFKDLLNLKHHSEINKTAFNLHLALHDAGKGDHIKNAVRRTSEGHYLVHLASGDYYKFISAQEIKKCTASDFERAKEYVDHDAGLEHYGLVGAAQKKCTATEYILWGGPTSQEIDKKALTLCDRLLTLCNEMNFAQIIQGEIPFAGIKKGLDLFFAAYKENPQLAELIFAHHCYDIYGAAPVDSMMSMTGNSSEIHLKIHLLYQTMVSVANEEQILDPSEEAYTRYRLRLKQAIPQILRKDSSEDLAKTRIAQMLRCHLFKTVQNENSHQISISEAGLYDARTRLFVESLDLAFDMLTPEERGELTRYLDNTGTSELPAAMVMYGPKLLLCATTGAEFVKIDPTDKLNIAKCLAPMLKLYSKLYALQLIRSNDYSVIDVNELAQITQKVFTWYKDAELDEKEHFANLLFKLQEKGQTKFLAQLGDVQSKSAKETQKRVQEAVMEMKLSTTPIETLYTELETSDLKPVEKNTYKKELLVYQLDHLKNVSDWQQKLRNKPKTLNEESIIRPITKEEAANQALLNVIQCLIMDTKWDVGYFGGEKIESSTGIKNIIPKGMHAVHKEIIKAQNKEQNYTQALEIITGMIKTSAQKNDHGFFNKRGETSQIFYDKTQALLSESATRNPFSIA